MKRYTIGLITLLLIVGCSKEPINYETSLVEREGIFYTNDTNEPYSGPVISLYEDGKKKDEGSMKDGKMVSYKEFEWHENGQKSREATFKYGELHGLVTEWHENGQKWREGTANHGEPDGLYTEWDENGQKFREKTYKDGKEVGLSLQWHDNGQKEWEITYKDGKEVGLGT